MFQGDPRAALAGRGRQQGEPHSFRLSPGTRRGPSSSCDRRVSSFKKSGAPARRLEWSAKLSFACHPVEPQVAKRDLDHTHSLQRTIPTRCTSAPVHVWSTASDSGRQSGPGTRSGQGRPFQHGPVSCEQAPSSSQSNTAVPQIEKFKILQVRQVIRTAECNLPCRPPLSLGPSGARRRQQASERGMAPAEANFGLPGERDCRATRAFDFRARSQVKTEDRCATED